MRVQGLQSRWLFLEWREQMIVSYDELKNLFKTILLKHGMNEEDASLLSRIISDNTLDGVSSHGINRFERIVSNIDSGVIDISSSLEKTGSAGSMEVWNGHFGPGPVNAYRVMERAVGLALEHGIGLAAISHNNHWLRGATYGLLAADAGCIGICWSNTKPNMLAWGAKESSIGNNPFVISVPQKDGAHFIFDSAMSQYSYGQLQAHRLRGEQTPFPCGYDDEGAFTCDPGTVERNGRLLPMGYWKGSGLSVALDLVANVLACGLTVSDVGKMGDERGLTQVMIAIDPLKLNDSSTVESYVDRILSDLKASVSIDGRPLRYPGERLFKTRTDNRENGISVNDEIYSGVLNLLG